MWPVTGILSSVADASSGTSTSATCIAEAGSLRVLWPIAIAVMATWYMCGAIRLSARPGPAGAVGSARIIAMAAGLSVLAVALVSPVARFPGGLLSAHMMQHLLIMLFASPLIVWGRPAPVFSAFLPRSARKAFRLLRTTPRFSGVVDLFRRPATAWILFSGSIAFWHLPPPYRWALDGAGPHAVMQLTFLVAGLLFWSVVLEPSGGRRRLDLGASILFVFSTAMVTGLPGAVLSFASKPIYFEPSGGLDPLGMRPLQDQRLAGLIMWIPMDLILFAVAGALFVAWLEAPRPRLGYKEH
jgi:cytochrome c oxidase assembly factor CtaG